MASGTHGKEPPRSAFGVCPVCGSTVPLLSMPVHIEACLTDTRPVAPVRGPREARAEVAPPSPDETDGEQRCPKRKREAVDAFALMKVRQKRKQSSSRRSDDGTLGGHWILDEFVDAEEEASILRALDGDSLNAWRETTFNGRSRGKCYGRRVDLARKSTAPPLPGREMPAWLAFVVARIEAVVRERVPGIASFRINECNAIDYRRRLGHELHAHVDDRQLSGPVICNLSLAGDAIMQYKGMKKNSIVTHNVRLPRRCLQIQSGASRYDYSHGIDNANLLADRRVSITFRESVVR